MKAFSFFTLFLVLSLLFFSCDKTLYIDFNVDPMVDPLVASEILSIPLPDGIAFSDDPAAAKRISVILAVKSWEKSLPVEDGATSAEKLLRREWFVPAVHYASGISQYTSQENTPEIPIVPLTDLKLPNRALPVDGRYPGDSEYPFYRDTTIMLTSEETQDRHEGALAALADWIELLPATREKTEIVWFAGVGDLMPGRGVSQLLRRPDGLETVFTDTLPVLQRVDLLAGNLEGAVTNRGVRKEKSYTFNFQPAVLDSLKSAGFDYLSITNNHSFDFGEIGFLDTLHHLKSSGIATSGAGVNPPAATAPSVFKLKGEEIGVLSMGAYPPERNGFDGEAITSVTEERSGVLWADSFGLKAVDAAFAETRFDVLMVHGGVEWSTAPTPEQRELYRGFIDSGAEAVIGSHPHVLQGIEVYKGGLIAYSLGNFIFPGMDETAYGEESLILLLGIIDKKVAYIEMVPVTIDGKTLSIDTTGQILNRVLQRTRNLD